MDPKQHDYVHQLRRRRRLRCLILSGGCVLLFVILIVALGATVFRPRHAVTTVDAVHLAGLNAGLGSGGLGSGLNVTMSVDLTATNPNHASFHFPAGGEAQLYYRGTLVGEGTIPPGEVGPKGSVNMTVEMTVMAGRLVADGSLYSDAIAGSVPFLTTTRIPGRVKLLGFIKHHMVSYTTCDIVVGVQSQSVENSSCRYKNKF